VVETRKLEETHFALCFVTFSLTVQASIVNPTDPGLQQITINRNQSNASCPTSPPAKVRLEDGVQERRQVV